jgi:hypothetical protein
MYFFASIFPAYTSNHLFVQRICSGGYLLFSPYMVHGVHFFACPWIRADHVDGKFAYILLFVDGPDLLSKWTMCEKLITDCKDYEIAWVIFNQVRQFVQLEAMQKWNSKIQIIHRVFRLTRVIFLFLLYSSLQLISCISLNFENYC